MGVLTTSLTIRIRAPKFCKLPCESQEPKTSMDRIARGLESGMLSRAGRLTKQLPVEVELCAAVCWKPPQKGS